MNIRRKAFSIGTSAALLASLLATVVAPVALATVTATSAGNVLVSTTSTGSFSLAFVEDAVNGGGSPVGNLILTLGNGGQFSAPVVSSTASFASTGTLSAGNTVLTITVGAGNTSFLDSITVTGKIKAGATTGAIKATVTDSTAGTVAARFLTPTSATPSGTLASFYPNGTVTISVANTGCPFVAGAFTIGGDAYVASAPGAIIGGFQSLTTTALVGGYAAGTAVTQAIGSCVLAANNVFTVATAIAGISYYAVSMPGILNDRTNQTAGDLEVDESNVGALPLGTVLAFTITTPGIMLSNVPCASSPSISSAVTFQIAGDTVTLTAHGLANDTPVSFSTIALTTGISTSTTYYVVGATANTFQVALTVGGAAINLAGADGTGTLLSPSGLKLGAVTVDTSTWRSFSVTVTHASTSVLGAAAVVISCLNYDVAPATVVSAGTQVSVSMTNSKAVPQDAPSAINAVVSTTIAAAAATPTVYIGFNHQNTGMITLTERGAGFFTTSTGNNNEFSIDLDSNGSIDTVPWAIVTPGAGALTLVDPTTGLPVMQAPGKPGICGQDYTWSIYAASTTASTISIVGANATGTGPLAVAPGNGPQVSIPLGEKPGPVFMDVDSGNIACATVTHQHLTVAYRAFKNQLGIAALSAPWMLAGSINNPAGNLLLTETQAGQLGGNFSDTICIDVHFGNVDFGTLNTAAQPLAIANTNVSGLIIGPVSFGESNCGGWSTSTNTAESMRFRILQQSTSALGTVTISNIKYNVWPGGAQGEAVALNVFLEKNSSVQDSQGFVVNAYIGKQPSTTFTVGTALGATKNATFTSKTKVAKLGAYVTWRFDGPAAFAGKLVTIWVATKQADGTWGAPVVLTSRLTDLNGDAYFWWKFSSATWVAVKANFAGDASFGPFTSASPQARWK